MSDIPLVSVGLVTWNSAAYLPACLVSLRGQCGPSFELIVVDNHSTDDSLEIVRRHFPEAQVICNPENRGFTGGHNQAIRASCAQFYLALNPDIMLQAGFIQELLAVLEADERAGSAAGKLLLGSPDQQPALIDSTGLFLDCKRRQYLRGFNQPDCGQYDQPGEVWGVDGAAPLYRRAMLEDLQLDGQYFDECFFAHKEDVDLAWRARLAGWRCQYTPRAVAYHRRSFRPGRRAPLPVDVRYHAVKNRYLLLIKNESPSGWRRDGLRILFYDFKILAYLLFFEPTSLKAVNFIRRNRRELRRQRDRVWSKVRVSEADILSWFA